MPQKAEQLKQVSQKTYVGERQFSQYEYKQNEEYQMKSVALNDDIADHDNSAEKRRM